MVWITEKGYRCVSVKGRNRFEHDLVAEKALGRPLPARAVVHHLDENPANNAPTNLVICPNERYHNLLHIRMRAFAATGQWHWRKCPYCGEYDDPQNMRGEKCGRFVHRECSARARRYYGNRARGIA